MRHDPIHDMVELCGAETRRQRWRLLRLHNVNQGEYHFGHYSANHDDGATFFLSREEVRGEDVVKSTINRQNFSISYLKRALFIGETKRNHGESWT